MNPYEFLDMKKGWALGLDDILLVPRYSEVLSRLDTDVSTWLTPGVPLAAPVCSAAMDTVTEDELAISISKEGGAGFLHRFASDEKIVDMVRNIKAAGQVAVPSIGVRSDVVNWVGVLLENGADAISIDIAHGCSKPVLNALSLIKSTYPHAQIIAGNVCTAEATRMLIDHGADAIKCGIGGGHACKTRIVTGFGLPNFTALCDCVGEARKLDIPVIMDGGIKNSGDIVKCLAVGASACMMGYLFSRTYEAPGEVQKIDGVTYKAYRGMASEDAQKVFKGGLKEGTAAEGESMLVPTFGSVAKLMEEVVGGIRSGLTYAGARDLVELKEKAVFTRITNVAVSEGRPFGLEISRNVS